MPARPAFVVASGTESFPGASASAAPTLNTCALGLAECGERLGEHVVGAREVDPEETLPGVHVDVLEGRELDEPGVVDEHVHRSAEEVHGAEHGSLEGAVVAQVGLAGLPLAAGGLDLGHGAVEVVGGPCGDRHEGAFAGEAHGDGAADSLRTAGDEDARRLGHGGSVPAKGPAPPCDGSRAHGRDSWLGGGRSWGAGRLVGRGLTPPPGPLARGRLGRHGLLCPDHQRASDPLSDEAPHPSRPGSLATWELDGPSPCGPIARRGESDRADRSPRSAPRRRDPRRCLYCGAGGLRAAPRSAGTPPGLLGLVPAY